jgi:ABC-2 type transport system ATP-binding protein
MDPQWEDSSPIYRQLRDRVVAMILEGVLKEGDPLPSVRNVAADFRLNPLTVLKGYQQLVDEQLVEKRRGRGMFVSAGARKALMKDERQRFLEDEWPKIYATIQRLGLTQAELQRAAAVAPAVPWPAANRASPEADASRALTKSYGATRALDGVTFSVEPGRIVGLIGPNGAGKTTALKAILGLTTFSGELRVLGLDPRTQRDALMREVCFIADVAVLPRWLRVSQALEFVAGVHPRFDRSVAENFLKKTDIHLASRVRELSKGMVTQLHLALVLAIDARLLVLDEPTLGLDLLYRRSFYDTLLNDYFDKERTILLTTHQVEEVENLLTDVIFINHGRVALAAAVEELGSRYQQLTLAAEQAARARTLQPFYEREVFGRVAMYFEGRSAAELGAFGELRTPSIADLFVAKMQGAGRP